MFVHLKGDPAMPFNEIIYRILTEAVIPGVGSILSFIPTIALMIFVFALLRESGIVRGELMPFLMGFSCSVPAILSCSAIPDNPRRLLTVLLIPYISCSAKLPVYLLLCSVFFPVYPAAVIASVYLIGILMIVIINCIVKTTSVQPFMQKADHMQRVVVPFAQRFRKPSARAIFDAVRDVCLGFLKKAFTVILLGSMVIWFLQNFDSSFSFTTDIDDSLLTGVGDFLSPLFLPVGLGDPRAVAALLSGLAAKEAAAGTLAVLAGSPGGSALCMMLTDIFTPASAFSFMVFCLLYAPCVATLGAIKTVTGKWRYAAIALVGQTLLAWFVSFLAYNIADMFL